MVQFFFKHVLWIILLLIFLFQNNSAWANPTSILPLSPLSEVTSAEKSEKQKVNEEKTEKSPKNSQEKDEIKNLSKELGILIKNELEALGLIYDLPTLLQAIKEGKDNPHEQISLEGIQKKVASLKENELKKMIEFNHKEALAFLEKNKKDKAVREIIPDRLQSKILEEGLGEEILSYSTPLISYQVKLMDGSLLFSQVEALCLNEAVPAFKLGLLGMKKKEKRILYVHPEVGFVEKKLFPPGALLTLEVEVLEVDYHNQDSYPPKDGKDPFPFPRENISR
jgi:FKBP-type peptidyl-prolyl cis-trans isomerase